MTSMSGDIKEGENGDEERFITNQENGFGKEMTSMAEMLEEEERGDEER
ncbi:hypothetical protein PoB_006170500 [Plakobranchus ocellatus]|uniref:Uncharacterized protein n=1 Tax=Plakobranchus ocellatus TaxID=259542 RepID=A0AAV4CTM0_9GAST|nr:hypothetical protein PoB_006170500 [Plakobranchus ocellatus]